MSKNKFRKPEEMLPEKTDKVPVSSRIKVSTREFLQKEAARNKLSLALLIGNIIEDYAEWIKTNRK